MLPPTHQPPPLPTDRNQPQSKPNHQTNPQTTPVGQFDLDGLVAADADAIAATASRAADAYRSGQWRSMVKACIGQDLSWYRPALKWEAVLEVRGQAGGALGS
jgi:hypothetical protein